MLIPDLVFFGAVEEKRKRLAVVSRLQGKRTLELGSVMRNGFNGMVMGEAPQVASAGKLAQVDLTWDFRQGRPMLSCVPCLMK